MNDPGSSDIDSFLKKKAEMLGKLQEKKLDFDKERKKVHSNKVYSLHEFGKYARLRPGTTKHLVKRNLLQTTGEGGVLGRNIELFLSRHQGLVPLHEFTQETFAQNSD